MKQRVVARSSGEMAIAAARCTLQLAQHLGFNSLLRHATQRLPIAWPVRNGRSSDLPFAISNRSRESWNQSGTGDIGVED